MTINQAIDKIDSIKEPTESHRKLRLSLCEIKINYGGRTQLENSEEVKKAIES